MVRMNSDEIQKEADKFIESERDKCDDCGIRFCYIHWPMYRDFMLKKARAEGWQKGFHEGCETVIENSDVIKKAERQRCIQAISQDSFIREVKNRLKEFAIYETDYQIKMIVREVIYKLSSKSGEEG